MKTITEKVTIGSKYATKIVVAAYNVLFTNDICMGQFIEAREGMKRTPWYKTEAKRALNLAEKARHTYENAINYQLRKIADFFADSNDLFLEDVGKHVEILYYAIKRAMDAQDVPCSLELARMELTRFLADLCCEQYDRRIKELRANGIYFRGEIGDYLRLTTFAHQMNVVASLIPELRGKDFNTADCRLAGEILSTKLADVNYIARAISVDGTNGQNKENQ